MTERTVAKPEIVVLHEWGDVWKEFRLALPSELRSGEMEFTSPGLMPYGWVLSLLGTRATLRRVGTLGASWAEFEPEDRVQLWVPGAIEIPKGVVVQVVFAEG